MDSLNHPQFDHLFGGVHKIDRARL
jgi:hypothetical protein